jgi:dihydrofolate reductase
MRSVRNTACQSVGATIMGRNMFGPIRGDWTDEEWKGWWGDNPPYHHPTFVLTHYPHESITMEGGTVFHFATDGIEAALERAYQAENGQDVRLAGGASVIRQYLRAGLVDEMHLAYAPRLLGSGERLFDGLDNVPAVTRLPNSSVRRRHSMSASSGSPKLRRPRGSRLRARLLRRHSQTIERVCSLRLSTARRAIRAPRPSPAGSPEPGRRPEAW